MVNEAFVMKTLKELHETPTAPYNEQRIIQYIERFAKQRKLPIKSDEYGNIVVRLNSGGKKPIAIMAHTDHPGFEAISYEKGALTARFHGGVPISYFRGAKPVFFPKNSSPAQTELISYKTDFYPRTRRKRVKEVLLKCPKNVPTGTPGMWGKPFIKLQGSFIHAWAHDDVSGVALILCALNECIERKLKVNIYAIFSRAEETGFTGCIGFFETLKKHKLIPEGTPVISVETSKHLPGARQGKGIVLRTGDRKMTFDPKLINFMEKTAGEISAETKDFAYQKKLMDGGTCEATVFTLFGHPAAGLALPLGNYHNVNRRERKISPEIIHKRDLLTGIRLFAEMAARIGKMEEQWKDLRNWLLEHSAAGRGRLKNGRW